MGLDGLVDVVEQGVVFHIRKIFDIKVSFGLFNALGGEGGGFCLLVDNVVAVVFFVDVLFGVDFFYLGHFKGAGKFVGLFVKVGGFFALSGYDKRSSGLVYEYRVDLVDDGKIVSPLNLLLEPYNHIVAEVIEAHFVVGAVGYVGGVGLSALLV